MDSNLILKIRWKNPLVGKLFLLYSDFLPQVYRKIGCEMYIENIADGALIFFKGMIDFVRFHQLARLVSIPAPPQNLPDKDNDDVELYIEVIKLPTNVTVDDLLPGVAKCYQIISKKIEVQKLSETSAVIRYHDAYIFEAIIEFLKDFWDKNRDVNHKVPNKAEVIKVFENLTL